MCVSGCPDVRKLFIYFEINCSQTIGTFCADKLTFWYLRANQDRPWNTSQRRVCRVHEKSLKPHCNYGVPRAIREQAYIRTSCSRFLFPAVWKFFKPISTVRSNELTSNVSSKNGSSFSSTQTGNANLIPPPEIGGSAAITVGRADGGDDDCTIDVSDSKSDS